MEGREQQIIKEKLRYAKNTIDLELRLIVITIRRFRFRYIR